ncbi:(d)CMP kinase, partial [Methylobacterium oryzae]|uniref:(d)CMP kinase n=1 Tax=Methylobacterium oryzae TaxID=334852 RepID=UPI002F2DB9BD
QGYGYGYGGHHGYGYGRGEAATFAAILADIEARDARDASRSAAPLRMAEDAVRLDTTELDADAAFDEARDIVERTRGDAA